MMKSILLLIFMSLSATSGADPLPLPKTGQTLCFDEVGTEIACAGTGQDGEFQNGVEWPDPRFTDNGDGTVTDNLTEFVWLQWILCSRGTWSDSLTFANQLAHGTCGLTDGSLAGDWRLPNVRELSSVTDFAGTGGNIPALPRGHPFQPVLGPTIWSSTTDGADLASAYAMGMGDGSIRGLGKMAERYAWAVRDSLPPPSQCSDGIDNDGDGWIDLEDHQCRDASQNSERHPNR